MNCTCLDIKKKGAIRYDSFPERNKNMKKSTHNKENIKTQLREERIFLIMNQLKPLAMLTIITDDGVGRH